MRLRTALLLPALAQAAAAGALVAAALCLALALSVADVLWFVLLHYELPDECLGDEAGFWLCY